MKSFKNIHKGSDTEIYKTTNGGKRKTLLDIISKSFLTCTNGSDGNNY